MALSPHPFLSNLSAPGSVSLPPQLIPLADKDKDWKKGCMDSLEAVGRNQYWDKLKITENYQMLNGRFLRYQYEEVDDNEYLSLVQQAQKHFSRELRMHHFDFIAQIVNTLCGELEGLPSIFPVIARGDTVDNERVRKKAELLQEYVNQQIDAEINAGLVRQGLDPQKSDFSSEQEQAAHDEQLQQARKALTPAEIQKFMDTKWQHVAEIWGNITLEDCQDRFELARKATTEFRDMLASDHCFRHFYLTGTGFSQETWNPKEVFYSMSSDETDVEKGDLVGRSFQMSLSQVIDKYGHLLTGKELEELYGDVPARGTKDTKRDWSGNKITYTAVDGTPYGVRVPWISPWLNQLPQVSQTTSGVPQDIIFGASNGRTTFSTDTSPQYWVTEGYWKSQKKVGRLTWINPETGLIEKVIVDETVVLPLDTKEKEGNLYRTGPDDDSANPTQPTIEWTWINEVWGGIKLMPLGSSSHVRVSQKPLYLNVKPLPFQGKPDAFLYEATLPVIGSVFNARNAESQSLVDLVKPYQIAFNLYLNQAYVMAEEEILPFLLMDVNAIPKLKDWGGKEGFEKWMESLRSLHMGPLDTRPGQMGGANGGGQLPAVINLDVTQRMMTRFELAQQFKRMALEEIGIAPQRLGDVKSTETATGINTATQRSYTQTAGYFSRFFNYLKRTLQKTLDFAQYTQANDLDITASAIHSDFTNSFQKLNGTELLTTQLHVYVVDGQAEKRNLEVTRQLAMENNTSPINMLDRMDMATMSSVQKIRETVRNSDLKNEQMQAQAQDMEAQKLQQAQALQKQQQDFLAEQNRLDREARKEEAYIKTFSGKNNTTTGDVDGNGQFDSLEYARLSQAGQANGQKAQSDAQKNELSRVKLLQDQQQHEDSLSENEKNRRAQKELAQMKLSQAKIQGDKSK